MHNTGNSPLDNYSTLSIMTLDTALERASNYSQNSQFCPVFDLEMLFLEGTLPMICMSCSSSHVGSHCDYLCVLSTGVFTTVTIFYSSFSINSQIE